MRGPELGGLVAGRRRDPPRRERAGVPPVPSRRGSVRRGPDGDVARRRPPRLPRRLVGGRRMAATRPPAARPARARPRSRLARLSRRLPRARGRRHGANAHARRVRRRARPAVRRRGPRDARPRARGRGTRRVGPGAGGDGLPRRGHRDRARGRRDYPDLRCMDLLLPRLRVRLRPRLRARVRVVRPHRGVRRALRKPVHARLLQGRVRRSPPLARPLAPGGRRAHGGDRRLFGLAAGVGRRPVARPRRAEAAAGTARRGGAAHRGRRSRRRSLRPPRAPRARRRRRVPDRRPRRGRVAAGAGRPATRPLSGARAARPRPSRER
jgi:hypothetical protein